MRKKIAALAAAAMAISTVAFAGSADAATAAAGTTQAAAHRSVVSPHDGHGQGIYYVWTTVNLRNSNPTCHNYPSTWNCPLEGSVPAGAAINITCQDPGESINGNPYWVWAYVFETGQYGFLASYFVENSTNWIDGVPLC